MRWRLGRDRRWMVAMRVEELLEKGKRLKNGMRVEILHIQTLPSVGKGFYDLLMAPPGINTKCDSYISNV